MKLIQDANMVIITRSYKVKVMIVIVNVSKKKKLWEIPSSVLLEYVKALLDYYDRLQYTTQ